MVKLENCLLHYIIFKLKNNSKQQDLWFATAFRRRHTALRNAVVTKKDIL